MALSLADLEKGIVTTKVRNIPAFGKDVHIRELKRGRVDEILGIDDPEEVTKLMVMEALTDEQGGNCTEEGYARIQKNNPGIPLKELIDEVFAVQGLGKGAGEH